MKTYTLTGAQSFSHKPEHPERTAKRQHSGTLDFDVTYRVWPNRESMLKTIEMQGRRAGKSTDWKACQ